MLKQNVFLILFAALICTSKMYGEGVFQKDASLVEQLQKNKIRLIVMRHSESLNNRLNIISSIDSPINCLTASGIQETWNVALNLFPEGINAIYTSPLIGSVETALIVGNLLQIPPEQIQTDDGLIAQNFGTFEGFSFNDYSTLFPSFQSMLKGDPPGGEPGSTVFERSSNFLWQISLNPQNTVLIVTHAFNYCHISMCLTGAFGPFPEHGRYIVYDFSSS